MPCKDEWIEEYSGIPLEHAHALGIFTAYFNFLEAQPDSLLACYLDMPANARHLLYYRMTNRERTDLVLEIAEAREKRPEVLDCIRHGLKCFDICVENRNILVHAQHEASELAQEGFQARKRSADNPSRIVHFDLPLSRLRKAVDDMAQVSVFLALLTWFIENPGGHPEISFLQPTLPAKPAQPSKLTPRQLRPAP